MRDTDAAPGAPPGAREGAGAGERERAGGGERESVDARGAAARPRGIVHMLARRRVPFGFAAFVLALWFSEPTQASLVAGAVVAGVGEALRIWAAGHLHKGQEVTASGPYRLFAHPLYVGSTMLGAGLAAASRSLVVTLVVAAYLGATLTAAIRTEEARLRERFGDGYDRYRRGAAGASAASRHFSLAQAIRNREHRAVAGVVLVWLLLLAKATYNGVFW